MTKTPPSLKTRHGLIVERIAQLRASRDILEVRLMKLRGEIDQHCDERDGLEILMRQDGGG